VGTLNFITNEKRVAAAKLVQSGKAISIGKDLAYPPLRRPGAFTLRMLLASSEKPNAAIDLFEIASHGFDVTHLDAVAHTFFEGEIYNHQNAGRVATPHGLLFASIQALRNGIFTRGVLLDVAQARGVPWLEPQDTVEPTDLEAAEKLAGATVEPGDAVVVRIGLAARERQLGPEDFNERAGLATECIPWLHERQIAVYSGDCVEKIPSAHKRIPLPLHMIGSVAMGLVLLDCPDLEELKLESDRIDRRTFLITCAPLRIPGGTGSPVNPICIF
jgi:kynurenine formamidase